MSKSELLFMNDYASCNYCKAFISRLKKRGHFYDKSLISSFFFFKFKSKSNQAALNFYLRNHQPIFITLVSSFLNKSKLILEKQEICASKFSCCFVMQIKDG
jgi:hypothetical protein